MHTLQQARCYGLLMVSLLLTACATIGQHVEPMSWQLRQQQLQELAAWQVTGRAALYDGRDSVRVTLRWQQQQTRYDIQLLTFLGQQLARLQGHNGADVELTLPDQEPVSAMNAELLMQSQLGWSLPLQGLRHWILGLPAPDGREQSSVDAQGRLQTLQQSGWHIDFASYQMINGLAMPRKLHLTHGHYRAKLVLDEWQLTPSQTSQAKQFHDGA